MATEITAPIVNTAPPNEASSNITATLLAADTIEDHQDGAEIRRQVRFPAPNLSVSPVVELIVLQGGVLLFR
jgi:hypothetical protein